MEKYKTSKGKCFDIDHEVNESKFTLIFSARNTKGKLVKHKIEFETYLGQYIASQTRSALTKIAGNHQRHLDNFKANAN